MGSQNIGDLLSGAGVTWGSFMGGFDLTVVNPNGTTGCSRSSTNAVDGVATKDYIPHHSFFNYHTSTSNPSHTRPASIAEIGNAGQANHQYDLQDFFTAAATGNLPAVSFVKAPAYHDGHGRCSDRTRRLRHGGHRAAWPQPREHACSGPLRLRPKTASAGGLTVGAEELRGPQRDRPDFDHPLRRRQLAGRTAHWSGFLRSDRQLHRPDV